MVSQTPTSEKMEKDGNVKVVENEGAASSKSKKASKDGLKNYLVSNLCWLVTVAKNQYVACLFLRDSVGLFSYLTVHRNIIWLRRCFSFDDCSLW